MSSKVFSKVDLYRLCHAECIAIEAERDEQCEAGKYHWYHVSEQLQNTAAKLHPGYLTAFQSDIRRVAETYVERFNEFGEQAKNMTEKEFAREQDRIAEDITEDLKQYFIQA